MTFERTNENETMCCAAKVAITGSSLEPNAPISKFFFFYKTEVSFTYYLFLRIFFFIIRFFEIFL